MMFQKLEQDINNLQSKSKQKDERLESLYIKLQEIYDLSNTLQNPITSKNNMLIQVRPEVFHQILIFLEVKQILQFRLLSKRANLIVIQWIPHKIIIIHQQINEQQNELQLQIQNAQQYSQDQTQLELLKAAKEGLQNLQRAQITELKAFARPTELIEKIINVVCLVLDNQFKIQKDNWRDCQKILSRQNFLEQLLNIDISGISEKQLQKLEQVNNISEQQAAAQSIAATSLLSYLKSILEIRQSKLYMTNHKIKQIEKNIKNEELLAEKLQKIYK